MKYLLILIVSLVGSCKSTTDMKSKNNGFLLSLSKEKTIDDNNNEITTYKNFPLKKVLNTETGNFEILYKDESIFRGGKKCLFLLEVFNDDTILISSSDRPENKSVAGPENFKRDQILLINKITGEIRLSTLVDGIYLKSHKGNLNKASNVKNVFAISSINDAVLKLEDSSGAIKEVVLTELKVKPLECE